MEFVTTESREATFVPPTKRSKAGWPHKTPTAADLARAGFYYKPSPHSNDNTVCFMCSRNLDGWEAEDDPIQEHLKHAEDCGWAVMMNVEAQHDFNTSSMEDPTGQPLTDARRATFAVGWPHENKRGWTCKTEKMIEAGWYFAPTTGSEDYVSCPYCKLSLDGWEPKDSPFEEHYSRSPGCPFFVFAGTTAPSKRPKTKKGRASRASRVSRTSKASTRLSTQSNLTVTSEAPSIPDLEESIDTSVMSIMSTTSTATTKGKRKAAAGRAKTNKPKRAKTARVKKAEALETEVETQAQEEEQTADIPYPEIPLSSALDVPNVQQSLGEMRSETVAEEVIVPVSPAHLTGPPELPTPTIPASAESPISRLSQRFQREPSPIAIEQKQAVRNITPPVSRSSPSPPSDVENAPPSTQPESKWPPLPSPGTVPPKWRAVDVDMVFESISDLAVGSPCINKDLTDGEKQMTVQEWIKHMAMNAEDQLRTEGERVVSIFEKEGQRALTLLEGIVCV